MVSIRAIVSKGHMVTFGLLILFGFIELILTGVLVGSYNRHNNYPNDSIRDRVRFLLFCSILSLVLFPAYLVGTLIAPTNFLFSIASHVCGLTLLWIFWLAGASAWSAALPDSLDCDHGPPHCHQLQATEAFAWIEWILNTFILGLVIFVGARAARSGTGFGGGLIEDV